ncbi:MAG: branched-chain amino acid ABC transporter permease [Promethearchaeota archaeon]|nr:MAG: branched-chain amino acid ABC transporter permease [Candidatus Lokiarchaeota archaeon]
MENKLNWGIKKVIKKSGNIKKFFDSKDPILLKKFDMKLFHFSNSFSEKLDSSKSYMKFWVKTFRGKLALLSLLGLILLPLMTQSPYYLGIFITPMIFTIFAGSWDFLAGYAGQVSFGHSIFFGIAGYMTSYCLRYFNFHWTISLLFGALAGVGVGLIIGIPCLRVKGPYLALVTMVFSLILFNIFMMRELEPFLGGSEGISGVRNISENIVVTYLISLIIMVISVIILIILGKSNLGTVLKSIRDDDKGSKASGINVSRYKIIAFMISGFFAGIAGGLFSMQFRGVSPGVFLPLYSFYAIVMAALGGLGTIVGSALGSFIFWLLYELLRDFADISVFILAIILILVIRFAEQGLLKPALEHLKDAWDLLIGK